MSRFATKRMIRQPFNRPTLFARQQGIALVTALFVVVLVSIAATSLMYSQFYQSRRTANLFENDRLKQYALGAEAYAINALVVDAKRAATQDASVDTLGDVWASRLTEEVDGVKLSVTSRDLQGLFNLNNLVSQGKVDESQLTVFSRLLAALDLPLQLADPIIDWLDSDFEARGGAGAEEDYYLRLDLPYRNPNQRLAVKSELLLIKGVTQAHYRVLSPYVTALPEQTAVNINTASKPLLLSVLDISDTQAEQLLSLRESKPFDSLEELNALEMFKEHKLPAVQLAVSSDYFQTDSRVNVAEKSFYRLSQVKRMGERVSVLTTRQGVF